MLLWLKFYWKQWKKSWLEYCCNGCAMCDIENESISPMNSLYRIHFYRKRKGSELLILYKRGFIAFFSKFELLFLDITLDLTIEEKQTKYQLFWEFKKKKNIKRSPKFNFWYLKNPDKPTKQKCYIERRDTMSLETITRLSFTLSRTIALHLGSRPSTTVRF